MPGKTDGMAGGPPSDEMVVAIVPYPIPEGKREYGGSHRWDPDHLREGILRLHGGPSAMSFFTDSSKTVPHSDGYSRRGVGAIACCQFLIVFF